MTIMPTPTIERLIEHLMAGGTYSSESEVLEEALRTLSEKQEREETIQAVREGVADADAGRVSSVDEVFARIYAKHPNLRSTVVLETAMTTSDPAAELHEVD